MQGQPAGKEEDSETSDESGPPPVPKSAWVVSGRQHHRLRMLVDQAALGTFHQFLKGARAPSEDVDIDGALVAYSKD